MPLNPDQSVDLAVLLASTCEDYGTLTPLTYVLIREIIESLAGRPDPLVVEYRQWQRSTPAERRHLQPVS